MTRLESGAATVRKEWQLRKAWRGGAASETRLREHPVRVDLPPDLPLIPIDAVLIEQVFINISTMRQYTPPGSPIAIRAAADGRG
jgi:two-component system sensor histidine kinase KdpD